MMTMATPLSTVRATLVLSFLSSVRALCWGGLRLHCLVCCCSCFRILLMSDLSSSTSWVGSLEDACSVAVM